MRAASLFDVEIVEVGGEKEQRVMVRSDSYELMSRSKGL